MEEDLPENKEERDQILLKIVHPDQRQIDGLGGAVSTTSKVAIISKETTENWDINYLFRKSRSTSLLFLMQGTAGTSHLPLGFSHLKIIWWI